MQSAAARRPLPPRAEPASSWKPPKPIHPIGGPIELPRQFCLDGYLTAEQLLALAEIAGLGSRKSVVTADTLVEMAEACRKSHSFVDVLMRECARAGYAARMTARQYELFRRVNGLTDSRFDPPILPGPGGKLTVFLWRFPDRLEDAVPDVDGDESTRRNASRGARRCAPVAASARPNASLGAPRCAPHAPALRNPGFDYEGDAIHDPPHCPPETPPAIEGPRQLREAWGRVWAAAAAREAAAVDLPPMPTIPPPATAVPPRTPSQGCSLPHGVGAAPPASLRAAKELVARLGGEDHTAAVDALWLFLASELGALPEFEAYWSFAFDALGRSEGGKVALREILVAAWRKGKICRAAYVSSCLKREIAAWGLSPPPAQKRTPGATRQCPPGVRSVGYFRAVSNRTQGVAP